MKDLTHAGGAGLIDAHVHLNGKYRPLRAWLAAEDAHPTDGAVLVQELGRCDNTELVAAVQDRPGYFAGIGITQDPEEAERLLRAGLHGLRLPPSAADGLDEVWSVLDEHEAVASIAGPFEAATSVEFCALMERHNRVRYRFEHLAWLETGDVWGDLRTRERAIEGFHNISAISTASVMWSGFFHNSGDGPPFSNSWPALELTLALFGSRRIMWSGDWNRRGLVAGDHARAKRLIEELPFVDEEERVDILHRTAAGIFDLHGDPASNTAPD